MTKHVIIEIKELLKGAPFTFYDNVILLLLLSHCIKTE